MEKFQDCPLSAAGAVVNVPNEYTKATIDAVTILSSSKKPQYRRGLLTLTTQRLIWISSNRSNAVYFHLLLLPRQQAFRDKSSLLSARVLVNLGTSFYLEFEGNSGRSKGSDRDRFITAFNSVLTTREWEKAISTKSTNSTDPLPTNALPSAPTISRQKLGAAAIAARVEQHHSATGAVIESGFVSLNQLKKQAEGLANIAKAYRTAPATANRNADENELLAMMADLGIESPVTKDSAGGNIRLYREQLARQTADFLREPILRVGGVITLSDAYCLVVRNRATTELVSPEDFRAACQFFVSLRLPLKLVKLESGVLAIELDGKLDQKGAISLRKLAEERSSITAIDLVRIRHLPIQRATIMLEQAEGLSYLVRDESTDGSRFFPNLFDTFATKTVD